MFEDISPKLKCLIKIHLEDICLTYGNCCNEITNKDILKFCKFDERMNYNQHRHQTRQSNNHLDITSWSKFVVAWAIVVESSPFWSATNDTLWTHILVDSTYLSIESLCCIATCSLLFPWFRPIWQTLDDILKTCKRKSKRIEVSFLIVPP